MHDPELLIRTGGDQRLSNYLLWQAANSELVFREELWPEFSRGCFEATLREFRERRDLHDQATRFCKSSGQ
jgi:undecaprenyl diphosphate synthase